MIKVSLIGAGNIGTVLAYNLSRKQIDKIVMVDVIEGLAKGKCLDLSQSFPIENLNNTVLGTTDISQIKDSEAIIITAGIARKPGMNEHWNHDHNVIGWQQSRTAATNDITFPGVMIGRLLLV